ncbi:MAG: hydrogenase expression/formation protein HypE [Deltaproteobacteria bacterium]|nr:hydrogenase expression/formation protein HypE [Deltaproteobacteria bacterium]
MSRDDRIGLHHGAGGPAMRELVRSVFLSRSGTAHADVVGLGSLDDGAAVRVGDRWLVFTTDTHVVNPPFFPGGDIGRLAISGTVNDLAMMGATDPIGLACAVVLEEGFEIADLVRIQESIDRSCREANTAIHTGDTKVMGRGEIDRIVITTTGLGFTDRLVRDDGLNEGDEIIVSGSIGDHGFAVLAERQNLGLVGELRSDVAPLNGLVAAAIDAAGGAVVAMKDPTRGGVASALHEMAEKSGVGILLDEAALPVNPAVRAASELLGIDVLQVANEGKALLGVRPDEAKRVLDTLHAHPLGRDARRIGHCTAQSRGRVVLDTGFGRRLVAESDGELLPRIC